MEVVIGIIIVVLVLYLLVFLWYLLSPLWPFLLAVGIIWLIVRLCKMENRKERERVAREQREADAREREKQKQRSDISAQINMRLAQTPLDLRGIQNYLESVSLDHREFARREVAARQEEIRKETIRLSAEGDFVKAFEAANLLCWLFPDNLELKQQKKTIQSMADVCSRAKCFVMSELYGEPNAFMIQNMSMLSPEACRSSMQNTGPIYTLWYFAINKPFDPISFGVAVQAARQIKAKYFRVLIDPILACMYVANNQPGTDAKAIYPEYFRDAYDYIQSTSDNRQLQEFASALSWVGESDLERICKEKLRKLVTRGRTAN